MTDDGNGDCVDGNVGCDIGSIGNVSLLDDELGAGGNVVGLGKVNSRGW